MIFPNIPDDQQETILRIFARKKRIVFLCSYLPFILFISLIIITNVFNITLPFGILHFLLFSVIVGSFFSWNYLRCPHCNNKQDHQTWAEKPTWWARGEGVNMMTRQCVYCGVYLHPKAWEHELWSREWRKRHDSR